MWFSSWLRKGTVSPQRRPANRFRPQLEVLEDRTLLNGDFAFALGLGSTGGDAGRAIATDGANVYVTGLFSGTVDFDPGAGVTSLTSVASSYDTFVAKYSSAGDLVWARQFGGTTAGRRQAKAVASRWMARATSTRPALSRARRISTPARGPVT